MKVENSLLSVGIDIGTTTTHMVVCRLIAANTTSGFNVPRLEIQEREIVFESPIFFTPFKGELIDAEAVLKQIKAQYQCAEINPSDIQCGAIIITGESAKTRNAEEVIEALSGLAGDFVAASAGPDLESILAARGSGAVEHSRINQTCISNIDIGGGTTNIATYSNGELLNSWCFSIGGRFLQFDSGNHVRSITSAGIYLCELAGVNAFVGTKFSETTKLKVARSTAKLLIDLVVDRGFFDSHKELFLTDFPQIKVPPEEYWFSGGVASLMDEQVVVESKYSDMGILLAKCLMKEVEGRKLRYSVVDSPLRATVIGAGSHTVQLSGHTVFAPASLLPLKNVPIFKCPEFSDEGNRQSLESYVLSLGDYLSNRTREYMDKPIAILLPDIGLSTYASVNTLSILLSSLFDNLMVGEPIVIVLESDFAMALGQQLKLNSSDRNYVVIDGINIEIGDYIEIGKPISSGLTLPVTVKTLLFP